MFGYVIVHKPELKFREFDIYRSYYCGLCRVLKNRYGAKGQMTLTYDMTFLIMLLTGLYEPETSSGICRCIAHPFEKHAVSINKYTEYAADMNILLAYYKCIDDWKDDKKPVKGIMFKLLKKSYKKVVESYPEKAEHIKLELDKLSKLEMVNSSDIDAVSGCFGRIMSELFLYKQDEWSTHIERMSFYLGKFIYILDAQQDLTDDIKKNKYNPLRGIYDKEREENNTVHFDCEAILSMMIAECSKEFEFLPIIENVEILRNVLYAGVWTKYRDACNEQ